MPSKLSIRERVIRLVQDRAPIARRNLEYAFAASTREMAKRAISDLLSDNYIAITGTGRRGSPEIVVLSAGWKPGKCPMCGEEKKRNEQRTERV